MNCTSCGRYVAEGKSVFYLQVYLCPECAKAARLIRDKLRSELEVVLATLDDSMRRVLVDRKLPDVSGVDISSKEALALALSLHRYATENPVNGSPTPK